MRSVIARSRRWVVRRRASPPVAGSALAAGPVRLWCAAYVAAMLLGGALFGDDFYARADPFEVFSTLVARMSPWGERRGELVVRSPLANLDATPVVPGLVAGWPLAQLSGRPALGALALATGALFLGATVDGLLLGHWYLVDRRLSNRPIAALATWLDGFVPWASVSASLGRPVPDLVAFWAH